MRAAVPPTMSWVLIALAAVYGFATGDGRPILALFLFFGVVFFINIVNNIHYHPGKTEGFFKRKKGI